MKKYIQTFLLFILCPLQFVVAQDVGGKTLMSQYRTTSANIGKADITINYHSPSVSGRKIFGGIVPFDFVVDGLEYPWRAGSNQRTTIEFSHDVWVEGKKLAAGSYGFLVLVSANEWTLVFSSGKSWGAFNYDKSNDVLRVPVKTLTTPFQEWLSYEFVNPKSESVGVQLRWENTAAVFNVRTDALSNILSGLQAKEDKNTADFQSLAVLTLERNPEKKEEALNYLEKSKEGIPDIKEEVYRKNRTFKYKTLKGELLVSMGKKREGQKLINEALDSAQRFQVYYYALNKLTVEGKKKEAFEILTQAIKSDPGNFQNHIAFGEYYLKDNDQAKATEHFKKAYEMTKALKSNWHNYARYLYLQNKLVLENR